MRIAPLSVAFTADPSTTSVTIFVHGWYDQGAVFVDDVSPQ
jgi:chitinase